MYVPGSKTQNANITLPAEDQKYITCWHEIVLLPGDQYTIFPNTLHWFHAGEEGAVFSEFSTKKTKEYDLFTCPDIKKKPTAEFK
jgi:D-lyxose ketol-isomerase